MCGVSYGEGDFRFTGRSGYREGVGVFVAVVQINRRNADVFKPVCLYGIRVYGVGTHILVKGKGEGAGNLVLFNGSGWVSSVVNKAEIKSQLFGRNIKLLGGLRFVAVL